MSYQRWGMHQPRTMMNIMLPALYHTTQPGGTKTRDILELSACNEDNSCRNSRGHTL